MNDPVSHETLALLAARRSVKPVFLTGPGPTRAQIETMLTLASRVPDHGKLAPWRFLAIEGDARVRLGETALAIKLLDKPGLDEAQRAWEAKTFAHAPLVIGIVSRAAAHAKIPLWEQELSAGAVGMNLLIAAKALGFTGCWLTEWQAYDPRFRAALGLAEAERIAGFVHIGRAAAAIEDRPRPALADIVTWLS